MLRERQDVCQTLAERGQCDGYDAEAVVEILAETAVLHGLLKIPVRRGDDADIHRYRLATDRRDHALLQRAQQLGLHCEV